MYTKRLKPLNLHTVLSCVGFTLVLSGVTKYTLDMWMLMRTISLYIVVSYIPEVIRTNSLKTQYHSLHGSAGLS